MFGKFEEVKEVNPRWLAGKQQASDLLYKTEFKSQIVDRSRISRQSSVRTKTWRLHLLQWLRLGRKLQWDCLSVGAFISMIAGGAPAIAAANMDQD